MYDLLASIVLYLCTVCPQPYSGCMTPYSLSNIPDADQILSLWAYLDKTSISGDVKFRV